MAERFGKQRRLTRRVEFDQVYAEGARYRTPWFVCHVLETGEPEKPARLGLTASRRTGRAHDRNRYKRWAREVFRRQPLCGGVDIVVTFRPAMASVDFRQFQSALLRIFGRARLMEP